MKIARILCPSDLSEASAHAAEWAVAVAGYYKAGVTALHVVRPILRVAPELPVPSREKPIEESETERVRKELDAQFQAMPPVASGLKVVIDVGQPVSRILERAASLPADLIVMGTHGTSGFEHLVLGSVTEKVLRRARCPVLTVPPRAYSTSQLPFKRLLCAVDFSDASLAAVTAAIALAGESGASLTLLHVLEWPWEEPPPPAIEELPVEQGIALAEFRRYSEETAKKRLDSLIPDSIPSTEVVTRLSSGKPYVQILQVAAEERTDVIVIGVHGRNPVDMALFGSTTNQVVRQATCPVLTLRQ
jgi:nucleotide-binding universal stress UspA family protein